MSLFPAPAWDGGGDVTFQTSLFGAFFNSHTPSTSPHPTNNVGRVYPEVFLQVSALYRVRGGRTARKFQKGCTVFVSEP